VRDASNDSRKERKPLYQAPSYTKPVPKPVGKSSLYERSKERIAARAQQNS